MDTRIQINSVVQVNERGKEGWVGCLVQVSEIKDWGIQGWIEIPMQGGAFIRLRWEEIEYIGQAIMGPKS